MQDDPKYSQHERKTTRLYLRELFGSLAIYVALLLPSIVYGRKMDAGMLKTLLLASPMLGFLLAVWAMARQVRRMDEYARMVLLENIALAAAITAGATFTYGFLETSGYPLVSMFSVWMLLCGSFGLVCGVRALAQR